MKPKYHVGDVVKIKAHDVDKYGHDLATGLFIPYFFYDMQGKEFTIGESWEYIDPETCECRYRYSFVGVFTDSLGHDNHLDEYTFDEHWLVPICDDIPEDCEDCEVSFF